MSYIFKLNGEVPSKKNSRRFLPGGKNIPSKAYEEWHRVALPSVFCQAARQKLKMPLEVPVTLCVEFFHADERRRDADNGLSSILDLLVDAGILKDDKWQIVRNIIVESSLAKDKCASCRINVIPL